MNPEIPLWRRPLPSYLLPSLCSAKLRVSSLGLIEGLLLSVLLTFASLMYVAVFSCSPSWNLLSLLC